MSLSSLCQYVTPFLTLIQQVVNTFFGYFSFLGISAPNVSSLVTSFLGCSA